MEFDAFDAFERSESQMMCVYQVYETVSFSMQRFSSFISRSHNALRTDERYEQLSAHTT